MPERQKGKRDKEKETGESGQREKKTVLKRNKTGEINIKDIEKKTREISIK